MKILYHHRIRSKDGQAVHLEELIEALRHLGHEVLLVGPQDFLRASFGHEPTRLQRLKKLLPAYAYEVLELSYNMLAYVRLYRAYRAFRPDFIYERCNLFLLAGVWLKNVVGVPLLLEVNAPLARERASYGGLGLRRLADYLERWVWRSADFVLPVTQVLADEIAAAGVTLSRIVVIPNAIDPAKFQAGTNSEQAKARFNLAGKIVLGFTGFARGWHGLDAAIDLITNPDVTDRLHLLIVGEGPAIEELKSQAQANGVSQRVTFTGLVERNSIARYVAAFDIALLPKCVEYCSPLKLFEYMEMSKAIVAPDQPNIREILIHDVSCLFFTPGVPNSLTTTVTRLVHDDELRARLGRNAKSLVDEHGYTWRHNAERVAALGTVSLSRPSEIAR